MSEQKIDIIIYGAGIAGLWALSRLKSMGYDVLLLEKETIGGGQSIASQGIIHSGLKYALAGHVNDLARSISAMPNIWRSALKGEGPVDLSAAKINAHSQQLLIPPGMLRGITKLITKKTLGDSVYEIPPDNWNLDLKNSGFNGSLIDMQELVLDIPSVIKALAEPHKSCIRQGSSTDIKAKIHLHTAAAGNTPKNPQCKIQKRPLVMGMMKNAPYPLYAHLIGNGEKPIATITTHTAQDGSLVWYIGGKAAERESQPEKTIKATKSALHKYFPNLDLTGIEWSTLPIDRIEGKSNAGTSLPDTPTIYKTEEALYCWPTKLTFAPLLSDMIIDHLEKEAIVPSHKQSDFSNLPDVKYSDTPWDKAIWTDEN